MAELPQEVAQRIERILRERFDAVSITRAQQVLGPVLKAAQRQLTERLAAATARGNAFSAAQAQAYRVQIEAVVSALAAKTGAAVGELMADAGTESLHSLVTSMRLAQAAAGAAPEAPLAFDQLARLTGAYGKQTSLLQHFYDKGNASAVNYGQQLIQGFEGLLATGLATGRSTDAVSTDILQSHQGFGGAWWRAERIARTETSYAFNVTAREGAKSLEGNYPDTLLRWVEHVSDTTGKPLDDRVAEDSLRLHGQLRFPGDTFYDPVNKRDVTEPPNRPNDRATLVVWRASWGEPPGGLAGLDAASKSAFAEALARYKDQQPFAQEKAEEAERASKAAQETKSAVQPEERRRRQETVKGERDAQDELASKLAADLEAEFDKVAELLADLTNSQSIATGRAAAIIGSVKTPTASSLLAEARKVVPAGLDLSPEDISKVGASVRARLLDLAAEAMTRTRQQALEQVRESVQARLELALSSSRTTIKEKVKALGSKLDPQYLGPDDQSWLQQARLGDVLRELEEGPASILIELEGLTLENAMVVAKAQQARVKEAFGAAMRKVDDLRDRVQFARRVQEAAEAADTAAKAQAAAGPAPYSKAWVRKWSTEEMTRVPDFVDEILPHIGVTHDGSFSAIRELHKKLDAIYDKGPGTYFRAIRELSSKLKKSSYVAYHAETKLAKLRGLLSSPGTAPDIQDEVKRIGRDFVAANHERLRFKSSTSALNTDALNALAEAAGLPPVYDGKKGELEFIGLLRTREEDTENAATVKELLSSLFRKALGADSPLYRLDGVLDVEYVFADRGYYSPAASVSGFGGKIAYSLKSDSPLRTIAHELGHLLEYNVPGLRDQAFLTVKRESERQLARSGGAAYIDKKDGGINSKFWNGVFYGGPYAGKTYTDNATEVISMALEGLLFGKPPLGDHAEEAIGLLIKALRGDKLL